MAYQTIEEKRAGCKRHYEKYRGREIARLKENKNARRLIAQEFVNAYKAECGCKDCANDNPIVLDFHHLGDKESSISNMITRGMPLEKIKAEIEKCVVLCANCHRIEHYKLRQK